VVTSLYPEFATAANLKNTFDDTAILMLMALGQMGVILTRAIDLSVAANIALTGMCVALLNQAWPDAGIAWILLASVMLGAALGACNGVLVWLLEIPAIVVTLGTMAIYRGMVFVVSGGKWITSSEMSPDFLGWVRLEFAGFSTLSWLAVTGALSVWLLLGRTPLGRSLYAVGSNPSGAAYAGLSTGRSQFYAFTLSGAIAGLCGYLTVARYAVAYTDVALGFELQVIAACVIGGVSIAGGMGTVTGVILGCLFLGLIRNALPMAGISPFWQMAISGVVITTAVILNARTSGTQRRRILEKATT
jgi:rhamnose transport system permease protein